MMSESQHKRVLLSRDTLADILIAGGVYGDYSDEVQAVINNLTRVLDDHLQDVQNLPLIATPPNIRMWWHVNGRKTAYDYNPITGLLTNAHDSEQPQEEGPGR